MNTYQLCGKKFTFKKITNRLRRDVFALITTEDEAIDSTRINREADTFNKFYKTVLDGDTAGIDFDGEADLQVCMEIQEDFFTLLSPRTPDAQSSPSSPEQTLEGQEITPSEEQT